MMAVVSFILFSSLTFFLEGGLAEQLSIPRIVNGIYAEEGEFPYQVSLHINDVVSCGGSILNKNYVLTAAHCIPTWLKPRDLKVIAGTINLNNLDCTAAVRNVSKIIVHEKYEEGRSWNNDIALLKLDRPFKFNRNLSPAKLPRKDEKLPDNKEVIISGFGRIEKNGKVSQELLKTNVETVNLDYCQSVYKMETIRPTTICVQNNDTETGFCNGDSGGPLTADGKVVGIVSFSSNFGCASDKRMPQIFTRVSKYINWISSHMK